MAKDELKRVGITFTADGQTDFKNTLKDVSTELKKNQTEFKKTKAAYDESTTSVQKMRDQMEFAQKQMETYSDKTILLTRKLEELQKAEKENLDKLTEKREKLSQVAAELEELKNAEEQDTEAIKAKQAEYDKTAKELSKLVDKENDYNAKINQNKADLDVATTSMEKYASEVEKCRKSLETGAASLEDFSNKAKKVSETTGKIGDAMTKGVTAPVLAAGTAAVAAFNDVDGALDIILKKTGATGETLEEFNTIAKDMATTIPTSFEAAATAVGEVNTRFGVTGDMLEKLSTQFVKFADVNDTDLNGSIDKTQQVMSAFNLSTAEIPALLDTMTAAGQRTGISMETLLSELMANGAALREMGFTAADSINFLADMEKSGADVSTVLTGLKKAFANSMKDGVPMADALAEAFQSSEAAIDLFGSKAGPALFQAFQNGTLSIDDFTASMASLNDYSGTLSGTFEALQDPTDEFVMVMNEAKLAGYEIGTAIMPLIKDLLETILPIIKDLVGRWKELGPEQQEFIVKAALMAAAIGPVFKGISAITGGISSLTGGIAKLMASGGTISSFITPIIGLLSGPVGIVAGITAVIGILMMLYKKCEWFRNMVDPIIEGLKKAFEGFIGLITGLPEKISSAFSNFKLPKITLDGDFNLFKGQFPSFNIKWNASGAILKHPTIFGATGGTLQGGGEAGAEAVAPLDTLINYIRSANSEQSGEILNQLPNALYAAVLKALQQYKPGIYLDDERVGEYINNTVYKAISV